MKVLDFIYNETTISFEPTGTDDVMVNATEMAKVFDREVSGFLKTDNTKNFVEAYCRAENIPSEKEFSPFGSVIKVVNSGRNNGTWMNRIAALKFAAWLDADFEVWVWKTTDQIILGHYREVRQATIEKIKAEKELEEEKQQLLAKYPELASFIDKQNSISDIDKKRLKALRAATDQLRLDFDKNQ